MKLKLIALALAVVGVGCGATKPPAKTAEVIVGFKQNGKRPTCEELKQFYTQLQADGWWNPSVIVSFDRRTCPTLPEPERVA